MRTVSDSTGAVVQPANVKVTYEATGAAQSSAPSTSTWPNRASFNNPSTADSGGFGTITIAQDPRIGQSALKLLF